VTLIRSIGDIPGVVVIMKRRNRGRATAERVVLAAGW
jgi:hypothetical protein